MTTILQIDILGDRPDFPENWIVFNAPRPLYGNVCFQGEFKSGAFYAAIDPADPFAKEYIQNNAYLDARVCNYITQDDIMKWAEEYCIANGYDIKELDYFTSDDWRMQYFTEHTETPVEI